MKKLFLALILSTFCYSSYIKTNSLINEESPYLLNHAKDLVHWYPWNKKVLKKAEEQNKLIFVSIGYSTCHWCHVMQKESFQDKKIAKNLNEEYISIKIDKEELPHIDIHYQEKLTKIKNTKAGWPLNFILTPKKEIAYISTYIPNSFKYGVEGMDTLIPRIAKEYKTKNKLLLKKINIYKKRVLEENVIVNTKTKNKLEDDFVKQMYEKEDKIYHGFFKQPKFPLSTHLNLLYEISQLKKDKKTFKKVNNSLISMANGGIFDQIEGGFYRYSVYADWVVPHFEKMLYTQAELIPLYYKAYLKTSNKLFKNTIDKTIESSLKRFKNKEELYYSAIDADSLNNEKIKQEGFYYTYTYDEAKNELLKEGIKNYEEILEYLGFDDFGNFEEELNNPFIVKEKLKPKNIDKSLFILKKIREKKEFPFIDKKIITSWNALFIKSLFLVSNLDKNYLNQANKSLESLLEKLYINETLYHQKLESKKPKQKALLEDFTLLTDLLITAYQKTYSKKYLNLAKKLNKKTINLFYKNKTWYMDREKEYEVSFNDKYYVSAISKFFHNSLSIANLTYDLDLLAKTKTYLEEQKTNILSPTIRHPESIRALIRVGKGDIIIKSKKENLQKNSFLIEKVNYPFILTTIEDTKKYLACDEKTCFAFDDDLKKLIEKIDK